MNIIYSERKICAGFAEKNKKMIISMMHAFTICKMQGLFEYLLTSLIYNKLNLSK